MRSRTGLLLRAATWQYLAPEHQVVGLAAQAPDVGGQRGHRDQSPEQGGVFGGPPRINRPPMAGPSGAIQNYRRAAKHTSRSRRALPTT